MSCNVMTVEFAFGTDGALGAASRKQGHIDIYQNPQFFLSQDLRFHIQIVKNW